MKLRLHDDDEASMSMQSEGKDAKGSNHHGTRDGTDSVDAGNIGAMGGPAADQNSQQSASHRDDLLAGAPASQEADQALGSGSQGGQIQTGMQEDSQRSGTAGGNRQSGQQSSQQGAMPPSQTDDDQYDQGTVRRAP